MNKRYQVFVSSTYEDLQKERQEVMQALLELDCIPSGMELFPAASDDQWTLIKHVIDDCDYYLVILGGRYGSVGPDGKSYTQMEYEYAVSKKKPVIAFLHANADLIAAGKTESTEDGKRRLREFRELTKKRVIRTWSSPEELGSVVSRSIVKLIKSEPAVGWIRADEAVEELAAPEILRLRKQVEELQARAAESRLRPPLGTENLAHGEEPFLIEFRLEYEIMGESFSSTYTAEMTWNSIFRVISPLMLEMASELKIEKELCDCCRDEATSALLRDQRDAEDIELEVSPEDLRTIIIQLRSLGLIAQAAGRSEAHWKLTSYGDEAMAKLYAIPTAAKSKKKR